MLDFLTGGGGTLALVIAGVVTFLGFVWRMIKAGKDAQKVKDLKASNKQWVEADEIIGGVQGARRKSRNSRLHDDDGFKRP
jgi:hypothetical protein